MSEFHTQGPVPLDSLAHVERVFEQQALIQLLSQNWVLLLGPREHGKSTGIVRIKSRLREEGLDVITLDLQNLPPCDSYQELLAWIANRAAREMGVEPPAPPPGDEARELVKWLESCIPDGGSPIVVIIDEAANITNDEYRNSFYGQIRGISTARGEAAPGTLAKRLRFLFAGMFRPESMVHPDNSPFNVCERIETEDISIDQARELVAKVLRRQAPDLGHEVNLYISRAYDLVGGQPYLLQALLERTLQADSLDRDATFERAVDELNYNDMHTSALLSRVLADPPLSRIVAKLAAEGEIPMLPGDNDYKHVCILGIAKREGARLKFRNELYTRLARQSPQLRPGETSLAPGALVVALPDESFGFMQNLQLKEFTISVQRGAAKAFNAGSYRLALVGFGSALESLLIDWLNTVPAPDRTSAVRISRPSFYHYEKPTDPRTWRLINLMKVGREVLTPLGKVDLPEALREFRNIIHPNEAIKTALRETELRPEAEVASGLFNMVLRDIEAAIKSP